MESVDERLANVIYDIAHVGESHNSCWQKSSAKPINIKYIIYIPKHREVNRKPFGQYIHLRCITI